MNAKRREFLIRIRDDQPIYALVKEIGFGWALESGYIREVRPSPPFLDFEITNAGCVLAEKDQSP